jgi:hypothetical protein
MAVAGAVVVATMISGAGVASAGNQNSGTGWNAACKKYLKGAMSADQVAQWNAEMADTGWSLETWCTR